MKVQDAIKNRLIYIKDKRPIVSYTHDRSHYSDTLEYYISMYLAALDNNAADTTQRIKQEQLNRKWQRVFIALIIANVILWSQILTQ